MKVQAIAHLIPAYTLIQPLNGTESDRFSIGNTLYVLLNPEEDFGSADQCHLLIQPTVECHQALPWEHYAMDVGLELSFYARTPGCI